MDKVELSACSSATAQEYLIYTVAGGVPPPLAIPSVSASISTPLGIGIDISGNVYFMSENCIFKMDQAGTLTRVAGSTDGDSGDGGSALNAQLAVSEDQYQNAIAIDRSGNLYISDWRNNKIRKVSSNGIITTFAGDGNYGYSGDGGPAVNAHLAFPTGVAVDSSGTVYIADSSNDRIRKVTTAGIITTIAGNGTRGLQGLGGPATSAQLYQPNSLALDSTGNLYIGSEFGDVLKVSANGIITQVPGLNIGSVSGIAVDLSGNLYVSGSVSNSILKVSLSGQVTTVAGTGIAGFSGDSGPATRAQFNQPNGVGVDGSGNVYIADLRNNRIRKVTLGGTISTVAGNGGQSGDGGPAVNAQLAAPSAVVLDATGNLYIADSQHGRIRKLSTNGIITTVAGNGISGHLGDNSPATNAEVQPSGVAIDGAGSLYIIEGYWIRKVSQSGVITTIGGTGRPGYSGDGGPATFAAFNAALGTVTDASGNLYIADSQNCRVRMISPNGLITTVAGNGACGYSGDGGPAVFAQLWEPTGVGLDALGNLYIADTGNNRVRKVSANGLMTTVAGTGGAGYAGDGGPAVNAQLQPAFGVAVDTLGNLYVTDNGNDCIRKISPSGIITTIAGTGLAGYSGDGGTATKAQFNSPGGIAVDSSGNVYVADYNNNSIRLLRPVSLSIKTSATLVSGIVGSPYSQQLAAGGGVPPYKWTLAAGALARGLALSELGLISGTPNTEGNSTFTVQLTDSVLGNVKQTFNLTINPAQLVITSAVLPSGTVGTSYSQTLTVSGGVPPYTWSLVAGSLPTGFALSTLGSIGGTPSAAGTYSFMVRAVDGTSNSAIQGLTLIINYPDGYTGPPSILSNGVVSAAGIQTSLRSGSWATIFGANLSSVSRDWSSADFNGSTFPTSVAGVSVSIGGKASFVRSIGPGQINFQVPDGIATGLVPVTVTNVAGTSEAVTATVATYAPAFFIGVNANARNYAAATDTSPGAIIYIGPPNVTGVRPAVVGEVLTLWGTGFGPTTPDVTSGVTFYGAAQMADPVQIVLDNVAVTPQFAGITGAGLYQFNIVVPNVLPGDHVLKATVAGVSTPDGVWLTTQ